MSNGTLLLGWRKRWNRNLLRFLGRRVRTSVDIEDLAQETYLRLLRARDLGSVRNPQAYLLTVASHVVSEWRDRQPPREMSVVAWIAMHVAITIASDNHPNYYDPVVIIGGVMSHLFFTVPLALVVKRQLAERQG
jgi:hypothetical protein